MQNFNSLFTIKNSAGLIDEFIYSRILITYKIRSGLSIVRMPNLFGIPIDTTKGRGPTKANGLDFLSLRSLINVFHSTILILTSIPAFLASSLNTVKYFSKLFPGSRIVNENFVFFPSMTLSRMRSPLVSFHPS